MSEFLSSTPVDEITVSQEMTSSKEGNGNNKDRSILVCQNEKEVSDTDSCQSANVSSLNVSTICRNGVNITELMQCTSENTNSPDKF